VQSPYFGAGYNLVGSTEPIVIRISVAGVDLSMSIAQGIGAPPWNRPRTATHVDLAAFGHARVRHRLREWERTHRRRTIITDVGAGVAGVVAGVLARESIVTDRWTANATSAQAAVASVPWVIYLLLVAVWVATLTAHGAYATRYVGAGNEEYRAVFRSAGVLVALMAGMVFFLQLPVSRVVVSVAVPVMLVLSTGARWGLRRSIANRREAGACLEATLLVGDVASVRDMAEHILREPSESGMWVVGACVSDLDDPAVAELRANGIPVLGSQHDTLDVVERCGVEAVAVASNPEMNGQALRRLGWSLEQQDVDLLIAPGIVEVAGPRLTMRPAAGVPMLHIERPVSSGLRYGVKLLADRVIALLLIVLASPVLIAIAVLIKRDSAGPALFTQNRVGEGGRIFQMIKFRTMVVDAEARLAELEHDQDDGNGVLFKLRTDPRVTRVGSVLRRFSLDELPQLFNVLRGEMSLVGPRPPLASEVDTYESDAVRRLRVRPGMTGLWQVSGRSDLSWGDSVRLDLWYVDNWSLALDAQILFRTANAVFQGRGAY
jgi:exopolysaccharide biosynthesis polyprenyl glycosylphosphotransferase